MKALFIIVTFCTTFSFNVFAETTYQVQVNLSYKNNKITRELSALGILTLGKEFLLEQEGLALKIFPQQWPGESETSAVTTTAETLLLKTQIWGAQRKLLASPQLMLEHGQNAQVLLKSDQQNAFLHLKIMIKRTPHSIPSRHEADDTAI